MRYKASIGEERENKEKQDKSECIQNIIKYLPDRLIFLAFKLRKIYHEED